MGDFTDHELREEKGMDKTEGGNLGLVIQSCVVFVFLSNYYDENK